MDVVLKHVLVAHKDPIYALEKSKTKGIFYTGGGDGTVLKWDIDDPTKPTAIAKTDASVYLIQELDAGVLMIGNNAGGLHLINIDQKEVVAEVDLKRTIFGGVLDGTGQIIYLATADGILTTLRTNDLAVIDEIKVAKGHIRAIQKHPTQPFLWLGSSDHSIYCYDIKSKRPTQQLRSHKDSVFSLYPISSDFLVSGGKDAQLKLWKGSLEEWTEETSIPAHLLTINQIVENPQGTHLVTAGRDKSIKIWNKSTLLLEKVLDRSKFNDAPSHSVNRIAFMNENQLISVGDDRAVRIWEIPW